MIGEDCYKSYGSFVTHSIREEFNDANGIQPKFRDNKLLKKCANKFGVEFVTAFYIYDRDSTYNCHYFVKFGIMSTYGTLSEEN